jgi:hypothetical protein
MGKNGGNFDFDVDLGVTMIFKGSREWRLIASKVRRAELTL